MSTEPQTEREARIAGKIVEINEGEIRGHLDEMVRKSVEDTLNALLDLEADQLCGAARYERSADRVDTRAGSYNRKLHTKAGEVELKMPKLRTLPFETQIIERYKRRESSVEEALMEMYLAGVSVRRVEDITEALWGTKVSPSTVSELNKKIYEKIETWRNAPIEGDHPYVYLDGIWMKRSWGGEVKNVSVLVAVGVNADGYREVLGVMEGAKEDKDSWTRFLRYLKERELNGVRLIVSDKCMGLVESLAEFYPKADWQRCTVHFYRNVWSFVPKLKVKTVAAMLKAIHAQEDREAALQKVDAVGGKAQGDEAAGGRPVRPGRSRGNLALHEISARTLAQSSHQQSIGADHERDPAADASGWRLSGWQQRVDAGGGSSAPHCRDEMGHAPLHGHEPALRAGPRNEPGERAETSRLTRL